MPHRWLISHLLTSRLPILSRYMYHHHSVQNHEFVLESCNLHVTFNCGVLCWWCPKITQCMNVYWHKVTIYKVFFMQAVVWILSSKFCLVIQEWKRVCTAFGIVRDNNHPLLILWPFSAISILFIYLVCILPINPLMLWCINTSWFCELKMHISPYQVYTDIAASIEGL